MKQSQKSCTITVYTVRGARYRMATVSARGRAVYAPEYSATDWQLVAQCAEWAARNGFTKITLNIEKE